MRYVVSYDLLKPGQDYSPLWAELRRLGGKRVLKSQWVMRRTNTSATGLRDHFRKFIDNNDRLLVVGIDDSDWSGWNLENKISEA